MPALGTVPHDLCSINLIWGQEAVRCDVSGTTVAHSTNHRQTTSFVAFPNSDTEKRYAEAECPVSPPRPHRQRGSGGRLPPPPHSCAYAHAREIRAQPSRIRAGTIPSAPQKIGGHWGNQHQGLVPTPPPPPPNWGFPTNRGNKSGDHFQQVFRGPAFPYCIPLGKFRHPCKSQSLANPQSSHCLTHTLHCQRPQISPGGNFATFLQHDIVLRNYPCPKLSPIRVLFLCHLCFVRRPLPSHALPIQSAGGGLIPRSGELPELGNRLRGGGVGPPLTPTLALTLSQTHSHSPTRAPTALPTASKRPPNRFHNPL